jgi:hypothetical protein
MDVPKHQTLNGCADEPDGEHMDYEKFQDVVEVFGKLPNFLIHPRVPLALQTTFGVAPTVLRIQQQ